MFDYIRRLLIAVIMGLFVSLLFLGAKQTEAGAVKIKEQIIHRDLNKK